MSPLCLFSGITDSSMGSSLWQISSTSGKCWHTIWRWLHMLCNAYSWQVHTNSWRQWPRGQFLQVTLQRSLLQVGRFLETVHKILSSFSDVANLYSPSSSVINRWLSSEGWNAANFFCALDGWNAPLMLSAVHMSFLSYFALTFISVNMNVSRRMNGLSIRLMTPWYRSMWRLWGISPIPLKRAHLLISDTLPK